MMNDEFLKVRVFTVIIFMMISVSVFCQNQLDFKLKNWKYSFVNSSFQNPSNSSFIIHNSSLKEYPSLLEAFSLSKKENTSGFSQPKAYAYCDLAFFCKIEVQIEKAAKIPFKFRLGDVRYVDYLEKKIDSPK